MTTKTTTTKTEPPAQAVAQDAHWAAKMERLRQRKLAEAVFTVCDDLDVATAHQRAVRDHANAAEYLKANPGDEDAKRDADRSQQVLDEATAAYEDASVALRLRALPRPAFEGLLDKHKPTEEDEALGREWAETFHAALISAASVDGMTVDEAQELLDTWSLSESRSLFNAAYGVQATMRTDLGKG
ncbi:hypothetical protein [Streptomyces sp. 8L]|uniref:hypothetical protein n=1 Tax=Streptomyces sp. 8L TaxID=2877242 RepID=UPI001CD4EB9D|nr:hypothetical protein [Streptomyces sp. 8L]MCA1220249.1 hypothetical protein [Streptomyces sp. 8L]